MLRGVYTKESTRAVARREHLPKALQGELAKVVVGDDGLTYILLRQPKAQVGRLFSIQAL